MQAFVERRAEQPRLVTSNNDEIGELVRAFNTMLQRLKQHGNPRFILRLINYKKKAFTGRVIETVQHSLLVVDSQRASVHAAWQHAISSSAAKHFSKPIHTKSLFKAKQQGVLKGLSIPILS
ncbi:HAMP domain-containing protein [Vibrio chagasii]|nr:HAMP domain-containing protein [Vibrio chagasii]